MGSSDKFDVRVFQRNLRRIIDAFKVSNRIDSNRQFASLCHITPEHLSRMLNFISSQVSVPSRNTLENIASCLYSFKYAAVDDDVLSLFNTCGYKASDVAMAFRRYANEHLELASRIDLMGGRIVEQLERMMESNRVYNDMTDFFDYFLSNDRGLVLGLESISLKKVFPHKQDPDMMCVYCQFTWTAPDKEDLEQHYVVSHCFIIDYVMLQSGHCIPMKLSNEFFDFYENDLRTAFDEGYDPNYFPNGKRISSVCDIVKKPCKYDDSPEGRLLKKIFCNYDNPNNRPLYHTDYGVGFTWTETPLGFAKFVVNHKEFFESHPFEIEVVEELTNGGDTLYRDFSAKELDELCNSYHFEGKCGTFAVAAAIMSRMAANEFFEVKAGESEKCEDIDLDLDPVIYVSENAFSNAKGQLIPNKKEVVESFMLRCAKELHMPTFGDTIHYQRFDVDVKTNQVPIDYEEE